MLIKLYISTLGVLLALDALWLGVLSSGFYRKQIGALMRENINWTPAILFYITFAFALIVFAINPALEKNSLWMAIKLGALLGFISYAAYNFTNLATLKDWPIAVTLVYLTWGTILSATTSGIVYLLITKS